MTQRFGEREEVALWRVEGRLAESELSALGQGIASLLSMTVVDSVMHSFPTPDGKGGLGIQAYWVWTESFLVISTWPELGFLRVYLASCKPFLPVAVTKFLKAAVGPVLQFEFTEI